jgi:hypothetical protein
MEPGVLPGQLDGWQGILPLVPIYSDRELLVEPGVAPG